MAGWPLQLPEASWCKAAWCLTRVSTYPLFWKDINSDAACGNATSRIFTRWAQPYGFCSPTTDEQTVSTFTAPYQVIAIQGLMITACLFLFFGTSITCATTFTSKSDDANFHKAAAFWLFVTMILLIASFSSWASWTWAINANTGAGTYLPVWGAPARNELNAVPVVGIFGSAFGCCVAAFVLTLLTTLIHGYIANEVDGTEDADKAASADAGAGAAPAGTVQNV